MSPICVDCPWEKYQPCWALALASPCALRPHADGSWTLILTRHDLASASASLISASMILAASSPSSSLHLRTPTPTLPPPSQPPPSPSFFSPTIATAFRRHCPSPPSPPPIATVATANRHRRRLVAASLCAASPAPRYPSPSLPTYPPDRHHSASPSTLYLIHLHLPRLLLTSSILASSVTSTLNLNPSDPLSLGRSLLPPTAPPRHSHRE